MMICSIKWETEQRTRILLLRTLWKLTLTLHSSLFLIVGWNISSVTLTRDKTLTSRRVEHVNLCNQNRKIISNSSLFLHYYCSYKPSLHFSPQSFSLILTSEKPRAWKNDDHKYSLSLAVSRQGQASLLYPITFENDGDTKNDIKHIEMFIKRSRIPGSGWRLSLEFAVNNEELDRKAESRIFRNHLQNSNKFRPSTDLSRVPIWEAEL